MVSRVARDVVSEDVVVRWRAMAYMLVLASPLIWLWITTAHITSWFDPRRPKIQWIMLASAFGMLVMSSALPSTFIGRGLAFVLPYVILQFGRRSSWCPRYADTPCNSSTAGRCRGAWSRRGSLSPALPSVAVPGPLCEGPR